MELLSQGTGLLRSLGLRWASGLWLKGLQISLPYSCELPMQPALNSNARDNARRSHKFNPTRMKYSYYTVEFLATPVTMEHLSRVMTMIPNKVSIYSGAYES